MLTMNVPFAFRGVLGDIRVEIEAGVALQGGNDADSQSGLSVEALEWSGRFPTCTATIWHPSRGYDAMCGWVQFVRSSDSAKPDVFEMDPLPFTSDLDLPYCWYGTKPTLFDGPTRASRQDLVWRAHSFLCASPGFVDRRVESLAGFSWGFDVADNQVHFVSPAVLNAENWASHLPVLEDSFPRWTFLLGHAGSLDHAPADGSQSG